MNKLIPAVPDTLWHFTCENHGHPGIYGSGQVNPGTDGVAWLTDLEFPHRDALGLVRVSLKCDRGAVRYRVDVTDEMREVIVSWLRFRQELPAEAIYPLENFPGVMPRHWFVAVSPVKAIYDPVMKAAS